MWCQSGGASVDVSATDPAAQSNVYIADIRKASLLCVIVRDASNALGGRRTFHMSCTCAVVVCPFWEVEIEVLWWEDQ